MEKQNIIELVSKLSPIITLIITAIFINPINNYVKLIRNRKSHKIKNTQELNSLIEKLDDNFKNDFVLNDLKENYFYLQTGIETNGKTINSLIKLKDKLGNNYNWEQLRIAMPHYEFSDNEIKLKVSKFKKYFIIIVNFIAFTFFFTSLFILFYYTDDFKLFSSNDFLKFSFLFILPFVCGYYLIHITTSLRTAIYMKKILEKKEGKEKTTANNV